MDMSQVSELARALMDSWSSASGAELMANPQTLGVQSPEQINKVFGNAIKQEFPSEYSEFPGVIPVQGYMQGHVNPQEQVPMDDYDPLESFQFWDGENFYCNQEYDACTGNALGMQTDSAMPPLQEYVGDDDISRDDVFQIKDSELVHNPTLAELNSCNENIFDYVDDNFSAEDNSFRFVSEGLSRTFAPAETHFVTSPVSCSIPNNSSFASGINYVPSGFIDIKQNMQPSLSSSCPVPSRFLPNPHFLNACEEKFLLCPQNSPASESFYAPRMEQLDSKSHISVNNCGVTSPTLLNQSRFQENNLLSSSAPPDVTMASFVSKIKVEPPSHSPGPRSVTERSLSGFSSLSLSNDDESGSFLDDSDHDDEDDFSSDEDVYHYESDEGLSSSWPSGKDEKSCQHRKHRYFWQYNLQSRGAKTQNILPKDKSDPHQLHDPFDPVFSEECALPVKHSGKARRGDGNDLTPNPCKLFNIGLELKKLNRLIYNINPSEHGNGKPLSRKEKNKLASRVCRLKKKAQHEANKIKLYGLQQEHKKLLSILLETREVLRYKIENLHDKKVSNCSKKIATFLATNEPHKVAGNTAVFVNEVLERVAKGECDGGLGQLS
ncbi:CREB3 regulatory factor-like [Uloborus diversus]|uniref:CREB3 regulatory factor-like n=1 Tax=Uloborus diversus TaxID=327109 RepID=UPI00240A95A8|nr:CREB3 regulatory factor-like [Uloborus diversus]